jgi:hypothetical protein
MGFMRIGVPVSLAYAFVALIARTLWKQWNAQVGNGEDCGQHQRGVQDVGDCLCRRE